MDDTELAKDVHRAAHMWMAQAKRCIDDVFDDGYAQANPALVAEFVRVCAMDFIAASSGERLVAALGEIAEALRE